MSKDSIYSIATAAAGLGLAGLAYHYYDQSKKETGRDPWNVKKDALEYDYIILGGTNMQLRDSVPCHHSVPESLCLCA